MIFRRGKAAEGVASQTSVLSGPQAAGRPISDNVNISLRYFSFRIKSKIAYPVPDGSQGVCGGRRG
jgi:hypothetical protein